MRWFVLSMLLTGLTVPVGQDRGDSVKDDLARLDGTWVVVHLEANGDVTGSLRLNRSNQAGRGYNFRGAGRTTQFTHGDTWVVEG